MRKIFVLSFFATIMMSYVFGSSGITGKIIPVLNNGIQKEIHINKTPIVKGLIILNDFYAMDENFVYAVNATHTTWVKMPTADRVTFKVLSGQFARDTDQIFQMGKIIIGVDRESFSPLSGQYGYATDKKHIYGPHGIIPQADLATFRVLDQGYAMDSGNVFFDGKVVSGADSGSFKVMSKGLYAVDNEQVFYAGRVIEDVSPNGVTVKGNRAVTADGKVIIDGQIQKGEIDTKNTSSLVGFLSPYLDHFTGKNLPFWTLVGIAYLLLFSFIFIFFADRNDEEATFIKTLSKTCVAIIVGILAFWMASLVVPSWWAQVIGITIAFIMFIIFWGIFGWIKSILITLLSLIAFVFILSLGGIIAHSFFGDVAHILSFIERPEIRLVGIMKIVGIFVGTWLIMTQLGSSLARAIGQAFVATLVGAGLVFFLFWIGDIGTTVSVIIFSIIYGIILWIMRFRMVSNLFVETVRIIRIALIVAIATGLLAWIIL